MRIPTILSDANVRTGPTGPFATPSDFGALEAEGIGQLGQAGQHAGSALRDVGTALKVKEHIADQTWAGESLEQERAYINKWMADPQNNSKDTYADDLSKLMHQRLDTYSKTTKSPKALQMFRSHYLNFMNDRYESALLTTSKTVLSNSVLSLSKQGEDLIQAYRDGRDIPNWQSNLDLRSGLEMVGQNIDSTFGKIAPDTARKLREKLAVDASYATMDHDPQLSRNIILGSKSLDEHQRHVILNQIDEASRSKNAVELESFKQTRENQITSVQYGTSQDKIPLTIYQSHLPRDKAEALKMSDDALIDSYNRANATVSKMGAWDPAYQSEVARDLAKNIRGTEDETVAKIVDQKVRESARLLENNRVSWLQQNNPVVKSALKRAMDSTENQRSQSLGELYDVTLKYQGLPPVGTPPDERKIYLGNPTNDRHLMTAEEASQYADTINRGSPSDIVTKDPNKPGILQQVLGKYPGKNYQAIAFNDLVNLPPKGQGIRQEYQLAFLNSNAHWVSDYVGSIQGSKSIKDLAPDKQKDYENALSSNPLWLSFSHAKLGDNFQSSDEVDGFRQGILSYAHARSTRTGESPASSVKAAAQNLIGQELGFASVNGQSLMVMRDRGPGKTYRTDADIRKIGENLALSMQFIPAEEINTKDPMGRDIFPKLQTIGTPAAKLRAIRNAFATNGFWQTSNDGQSATLYYNDGGRSFQARDLQNRAFVIPFSELESSDMLSSRVPGAAFPGMSGIPKPIHEGVVLRSPLWPLVFWNYRVGPGDSRERPSFIHRDGASTGPAPMPYVPRVEPDPLSGYGDERP